MIYQIQSIIKGMSLTSTFSIYFYTVDTTYTTAFSKIIYSYYLNLV